MKKIMTVKNVLMAMVFSVAVLEGYQAYEYTCLTSVESLLLENAEALADPEGNDSGSGLFWQKQWDDCKVGAPMFVA